MRALKWGVGVLVVAGLAFGGYTVWERLSRVERQRMVHAALGDLLKERVHALSIIAREPQS